MNRVVAIEINGVLRDFKEKAIIAYKKFFKNDPEKIRYIEENLDKITDFNINEYFSFELPQELEEFVTDFGISFYGNAKKPKNILIRHSEIFKLLNEENYKVTLFSKEGYIARMFTLGFISDNKLTTDNINFIRSYEDLNDIDCDVIITANQNLNNYNLNKKILVINPEEYTVNFVFKNIVNNED